MRPEPSCKPHELSQAAARTWRPPPHGRLKCNVDAAFSKNGKVAALAAIIRDSKGVMVAGLSSKTPCFSSQLAEALAIRQGLLLAHSCFCENIILESDNLELIKACRSGNFLKDEAVIIHDIIKMKKAFSSCALVWASHDSNRPADYVAKKILKGSLKDDWVMCVSQSLVSLLHLDRSA